MTVSRSSPGWPGSRRARDFRSDIARTPSRLGDQMLGRMSAGGRRSDGRRCFANGARPTMTQFWFRVRHEVYRLHYTLHVDVSFAILLHRALSLVCPESRRYRHNCGLQAGGTRLFCV
jgi:hypothetical protein